MESDQYLEALLSLPRLGPVSVSPDGTWVAWSWFGIGPTADVYAVRTDGSSAPVRLTDTDENAFLVSWTPDSSAVLIGQDHEGDERVQLFRVALEQPRKLEPLTEPSPPYFLHGGQLHPNGRWLIYAMNFDATTGEEIEATWVYRHDLHTGERRPLAQPEKAAHCDPQLNLAGTHVLYERQDLDPAGNQVWLVGVDGQNDREILNSGPSAKIAASWFPDGHRVLFLAEAETYRRLGVWDLETGETRWLLDDPTRNIESAYVPHGIEPPVAVVIEIKEARVRASLLDVDSGDEIVLPDIPGNLIPLRPLSNGEWLGRYYRATQPADLVRFRPSENDVKPDTGLTHLWEHSVVRPQELTPAEDFRWHSVDGLEIQGWLYRAANTSAGVSRGTILHIHGGPTAHSEDSFMPQIQFFVAEGFHVLSPNYRGSTGFGLDFQEAIKKDGWGGHEQDDIRSGIEALLAAGIAEPGKIGMTGTSYGGYSSWCGITRWPPSILAASAPICGMTDLVVDYETTRPDLRPYSEEMMGGSPDQAPVRYRERSPIHFVHHIQGQLLIVQGLRDPNVSPENVRAVREALDTAVVPYGLLTFEDEGHGVGRPVNQRVLYRRLADFFSGAFEASTAP